MERVKKMAQLNNYPYGAVYYRKTNPPREDWERDYRVAAEDGMNTFRHWFLWNAIELEQGKYTWDDYDRQFELAEKHGIKTIISEITHAAPEWAFHQYSHACYVDDKGNKVLSQIRNSSVSGGFPGLCLDYTEIKEMVGRFLTELVNRYKDHPAMGGYDVWNECNLRSSAFSNSYTDATAEKFRLWAKKKYGDLKTLGEVWHRFSYTDWEQLMPPRTVGVYPDYMDWLHFKVDNAFDLMKWKVDLIRGLDPHNAITAHGVDDKVLERMHIAADHPWKAGAMVDTYGFTGGSSEARYRGVWKHWISMDITRSGANGKPFWSAEMASGPNWFWDYKGLPRDCGRMPDGEDIRLHSLTSMAGGSKGIFSNRWRPLRDGPRFGSLGFYGMDGSRTDRSDMAGQISSWANRPEHADIWKSNPVIGDVGLLMIPDSQFHTSLLEGHDHSDYANAFRGVYRGFYDQNIQADIIYIDQTDKYKLIYLPRPTMMTSEWSDKLMKWVEAGGILVSEGCPAYFGDHGRAGTVQPNLGMDMMFGAKETDVEFTADLLKVEKPVFHLGSSGSIVSAVYLQTYEVTSGTPIGKLKDGRVIGVENQYGKGKTLLIGTCPGMAYWQFDGGVNADFFQYVLQWTGVEQHVRCKSDGDVKVRLHDGEGGMYLWMINNERKNNQAVIELSQSYSGWTGVEQLWGPKLVNIKESKIAVDLLPFDGILLKLS
jgi:beta-galactosidase